MYPEPTEITQAYTDHKNERLATYSVTAHPAIVRLIKEWSEEFIKQYKKSEKDGKAVYSVLNGSDHDE